MANETNTVIAVTTVENVQAQYDLNFVTGSVKGHLNSIESKRSDVWNVKVEEINVLPGFNPRIQNDDYTAHIKKLTDLIMANGFRGDRPLSGVVLKMDGKDQLFIYDGHCRLEATKQAMKAGAEIERLPVVVAPKGTSLEDITAEVVNSSAGKQLSPLEVGIVCKRLISYGWDATMVANRLSITTVYVDQLLTVVGSPLKVREMIQVGKVSLSVALDALRKHGDKAVEVLEQSLNNAEKSGKARVTASMLPGAKRKSVIRKSAPQLHAVAERIMGDKGFQALSEEVRKELMALLSQIKNAEPEKAEGGEETGAVETQQSAKVIKLVA